MYVTSEERTEPPQREATAPAISVIVPTLRRTGSLRECLLGLANQELSPAEILVVVRDDDEETRAEIPRLAEIVEFRVVPVTRPGQVHALNAALRSAGSEIVAFIDDDAVPKRDWLRRLSAHYADPRVGAVGGKLIVPLVSAERSSERLKVGAIGLGGQPIGNHHLADGPARDVQWLRGANMSFRRELCRYDGSLRGQGAQVANDSEASLRVSSAGWRVVYEPAAQVFHNAAPREGEHQRKAPSRRAIRDAAYNETIALLRWLPASQRSRAAIFMVLVGLPPTPGPLGAISSVLLHHRPVGDTLSRCASAAVGRGAAVRDWLFNSATRETPLDAP